SGRTDVRERSRREPIGEELRTGGARGGGRGGRGAANGGDGIAADGHEGIADKEAAVSIDRGFGNRGEPGEAAGVEPTAIGGGAGEEHALDCVGRQQNKGRDRLEGWAGYAGADEAATAKEVLRFSG